MTRSADGQVDIQTEPYILVFMTFDTKICNNVNIFISLINSVIILNYSHLP